MNKMTVRLTVCLVGVFTQTGHSIPYNVDPHTLHLYHFDGDGRDSVSQNPIDLTLGGGATATDASVPGLGKALYTYEGTAGTAGMVLPNAGATAPVAISSLVGSDGAFTFEAIVCPAFGLTALPNHMQIISGDHNSSRGWHFRVESTGNLVFTKLTGTIQDNMRTALPSNGVHAFAANKWFHAAVTYNGQADTDGNLKLYWTALDSGVSEPVLLGSFRMTADLDPTAAPNFVVGNEGRDMNGRTENWEGWIDEVRISDSARTPSEMNPSVVGASMASAPVPANKAIDVPYDSALGWSPGPYAKTHDVYFGISFDDVNAASRTDPKGVLVSQGQDIATYDKAGPFTFGQTYYWRVDEVNAPDKPGLYKGNVWSFSTETYGYRMSTPIKVTASSFSNALTGPEKTIDGSGLDALDQHSTSSSQMWLSKKSQTPIWIKYEFDAVYSLHQMWVWNQNQMMELDNGYGAKDVTIEVSTDGATWMTLAGVPEFAKATGEANYVHNTTVDFGGVLAKVVRLNLNSNWGEAKNSGLSEVRFFDVPVKAFGPTPATGATGVAVDGVLNWRPGRTAASHEVYLGTDPNALSKVDTVTQHRTSLSSAGAEYDRTYYWKVNEVDEAQTPKTWEGDVWSFSTPGYVVVDDFESYNDYCKRIFYTWADGYGVATPECGGSPIAGNGSGSTVGNASAPYAEQVTVHGGKQSLPLSFDNPGAASYSEAVRTFDVPQDWVQGGIKTLVLYFHGNATNAAGQIYVKINNSKVVYNGKSDVLTIPLWRQWNIDLATVGGALRSVGSMTIGVSGTGKGIVYIDDIRLYRSAPAVVQPVDPGTTGLSAYYAMDGDVKDSSGKGNNGTAMGDPIFVDAPTGFGKALQFDGTNDYVDLPIGTLVSTLTSATLASRVSFDTASAGSFQRIFDFGTGTTAYLFLTPRVSTNGEIRAAIRNTHSTAESQVNSPRVMPAGWHHVAVVIEGVSKTMQLYVDGDRVASGPTTVLLSDLGPTTQNWLGRSQWTADGYLAGALDEFRIYNRALSAGEVRYLAGDR